jgi:hypothetical protein
MLKCRRHGSCKQALAQLLHRRCEMPNATGAKHYTSNQLLLLPLLPPLLLLRNKLLFRIQLLLCWFKSEYPQA